MRSIISMLILSVVFLGSYAGAQNDDRMTLPFDIITNAAGFKLLTGVEATMLDTSSGFVSTPFSGSYQTAVTDADAKEPHRIYRSGFVYEEIATLKELTEKSSFAIKASYKGFSYSIAAKINQQREHSLNDTSLKTIASSRVETQIHAADYNPSLPADAFRAEVVEMRNQLEEALSKGNMQAAALLRSQFRRAYGTGFIRSITVGGVYYIDRVERFSSRTERDSKRVEISGGGGGASFAATTDKERTEKYENKFRNATGKFVGGKYNVTYATWEEFQKSANEWAASVEAGKTEPLNAEYVPYYSINYLRPLTEKPYGEISPETSIVGYYGTPDRPEAAMIVTYLDGQRINMGVVPSLVPVSAYVDGKSISLLVSVDPDTVRFNQVDRLQAWGKLRKELVGSFASAAANVDDPPYLEEAYVWPTLVIDSGGDPKKWTSFLPSKQPMEAPVRLLVNDQIAANSGSRTEAQMNGHYVFDIGTNSDAIVNLIKSGKLRLATNWTADFMDIRQSTSRPIEISEVAEGGRIAFRYPAVPLTSEKDRFESQIQDAISVRIFAALNGPKKSVVPIQVGALSTRTIWARGKRSADFECVTIEKNGYSADLKPPAGFDLIGTSVVTLTDNGPPAERQKAWGCKPPGHCDSLGEACQTRYNQVAGCFVNSEWMTWYKGLSTNLKLSEDPKFICDATLHPGYPKLLTEQSAVVGSGAK